VVPCKKKYLNIQLTLRSLDVFNTLGVGIVWKLTANPGMIAIQLYMLAQTIDAP
jgi:hypothetical protein